MDIKDFLDWIKNVENFFDYMSLLKENNVKLGALNLKGGAFAWWNQRQCSRHNCGKRTIKAWPRMIKLLKESFLHINYEHTHFNSYHNCKQGSRIVGEYTEQFSQLRAQLNLYKEEKFWIARYVSGLKQEIQDKAELQPLNRISEATTWVKKIEDQQDMHKKERRIPWERSNNFFKNQPTDLQHNTTSTNHISKGKKERNN